MRRGKPDLELVGDGGEARVGIVDDEAPDLDLGATPPDAEDGSAVDKLPDVDDKNRVAGEEARVSLVFGHGDPQRFGFGDDLMKSVWVGRDVARGPDAFVQAAPQPEQPDDGLSRTGVHLERVVGASPLAVPG